MIDLALRDRLDRYEDALQSIVQWSEAYPLDIFPEPDWKAARKLLEAGGISLDSISAHCMRVWWKASARSQGKRWETADVHIRWLYYCYQVELTVLPALLARAEFTLRHKIAAMFGCACA